MVKIFLSVRNRLEITRKCIHALKVHSSLPHKIYVYDNQTNHLLEDHFAYFHKLYSKGLISQITFTSTDSTFGAFSKASTCNFFGLQHEQDPKKDSYAFLLMLDNDIIVAPEWDKKLLSAWKYIHKNKLNHIKVIGQVPGGIKYRNEPAIQISTELSGKTGKLGGSGFWSVRPDFFRDVGFLNLKQLVGHDKKHDQMYWKLLDQSSKGKHYILGLSTNLRYHCGKHAGSVCNVLTRQKNDKKLDNLIKFEDAEKRLASMKFEEFYNKIKDDRAVIRDW
jgi:hypothetical protein